MDTFSYFRLIISDSNKEVVESRATVDTPDFKVTFEECLYEDIIERKGFLFVVNAKERYITETRSGARIAPRQDKNSEESFSNYVVRTLNLIDTKTWEEINAQVIKVFIAHREAHLNLLI